MLQLILGPAGSGKSSLLLQQAARRAEAGHASVLLVPEQFSAAAEALAWRSLGDAKSALVEVLSFRTLAERILRSCGGLCLPVLGEADRAVLVRRAMDSVAAELKTFARQRRSAALASLCAQTLAELKTAGATPQQVRTIAENENDDKLTELALIYDAYETALADVAMDPDDRLSLAARRADCGWLDGKAVLVDSFDGFTAPEYAMLEQLMLYAEALTVALCCNGLTQSGAPGLFTPVRKAALKLKTLAEKHDQKQAQDTLLAQNHRAEAPVLAAVNRLLAGDEDGAGFSESTGAAEGQADAAKGHPGAAKGQTGAEERTPPTAETQSPTEPNIENNTPAFTFTEAENEWEEVRLAAAEMHRLALGGVPYSKMALVCRDVAAYQSVVRRQLALYGIPCFADYPDTIEYTAPAAFLRAGLALLQGGLQTPGILALLKTGLCGYSESDIAALENYAFTWAPKAADWRAPFTQNPDGLLAAADDAAKAQLAAAERLRGKAVPIIEQFLQKARGANARILSRQLYLLMDRFDAAQHMEDAARQIEAEDAAWAAQARRAWDLCMQLLDKMAALLGDETVSASEYDELFLILIRSTDFAGVPQSLECVTFSGADRMRLAQPDYCFVLGLCEGEFPMQVGYSGLLTHNDRDALVRGGIEMPGSFENRSLLEDMFFYKALCSPRKGLHLSWPRRRAGQAKTRTAALQPVLEALTPPPLTLPLQTLAATPAAAYDLLGAAYRDNSTDAATLYAALENLGDEQWDAALALLRQVDNPGQFALAKPEALARLVGREMTLSATVAEQYYNCRFSYYMERVLRVKPRKRAELSPLESGTFVHYVLEQALVEAGSGFAQMDDEALTELANRHADTFIAENLPVATRRDAWRLGQIKRTTARLLCFMRDAAAESDFTVDAVELEIGEGEGAVAPLTITAADGSLLRVKGKIDRVDVLRRDGHSYLCIVDYKTGDKKLDLKELYHGLNMQMVIYMDTLCQNAQGRYPNPVPAGMLYLGGDPSPGAGSRHDANAPAFKLNGLLLAEPEVLRALDHSGTRLPAGYKKDGSLRQSPSLAGEEKLSAIRGHVRGLLSEMAAGVHRGSFAARPTVSGNHRPCQWCAYRAACRHEDGQNEVLADAPKDVFEPGAIDPTQAAAADMPGTAANAASPEAGSAKNVPASNTNAPGTKGGAAHG